MKVIALNKSMLLSDPHDGTFVNSDYLTDALVVLKTKLSKFGSLSDFLRNIEFFLIALRNRYLVGYGLRLTHPTHF
jgi:hypothetical protein